MNIDFIPSAKSSSSKASSNNDADLVSGKESTEGSGEGFFSKLSALFKGEDKAETKAIAKSSDAEIVDDVDTSTDTKKISADVDIDVAEGDAVDKLAELDGEDSLSDGKAEKKDKESQTELVASTSEAAKAGDGKLTQESDEKSHDAEKVMKSGDQILHKLKQANDALSQSGDKKQEAAIAATDVKAPTEHAQLDSISVQSEKDNVEEQASELGMQDDIENAEVTLDATTRSDGDAHEVSDDEALIQMQTQADNQADEIEIKPAPANTESLIDQESSELDTEQMALSAAAFFEAQPTTSSEVDTESLETDENGDLIISQSAPSETRLDGQKTDISNTSASSNEKVQSEAGQTQAISDANKISVAGEIATEADETIPKGEKIISDESAKASLNEAKLVRQVGQTSHINQQNLSSAINDRVNAQVALNTASPLVSEAATNPAVAANALPTAAAALGGVSALTGSDTKAKWSAEHIESSGILAQETDRTQTGREANLAQQLSAVSGLSGAQTPSQLNRMEAMPTQVPVMINKEVAADQLSERVQVMLSKNLKNIDIRLDPPELGRMQIRMNMNGDTATVHFTVANQSARDALEGSMPRLREMLSQQGVQLGDTGVQQQSSNQQNGYASGERGQSSSDATLSSELMGGEDNFPTDVKMDLNIGAKRDGISYYA